MAELHKPIPLFYWYCIFVMGLSWSGIAKAGIGDTYFCDMKHVRSVRKDEVAAIKPERFMFQWKSKQIKFGKGGYFDDYEMPFDTSRTYPSLEKFSAGGEWDSAYFGEGRFRFIRFSNCDMPCFYDEVMFIVSDCSSFSE